MNSKYNLNNFYHYFKTVAGFEIEPAVEEVHVPHTYEYTAEEVTVVTSKFIHIMKNIFVRNDFAKVNHSFTFHNAKRKSMF